MVYFIFLMKLVGGGGGKVTNIAGCGCISAFVKRKRFSLRKRFATCQPLGFFFVVAGTF